MSCQRAQGFLETVGGTVTAVQDAKKARVEPADALKLARTMDKVIAAKGKKIVTFDLKADPPDDQTLLGHLIGPSGFLRHRRPLLVGHSWSGSTKRCTGSCSASESEPQALAEVRTTSLGSALALATPRAHVSLIRCRIAFSSTTESDASPVRWRT